MAENRDNRHDGADRGQSRPAGPRRDDRDSRPRDERGGQNRSYGSRDGGGQSRGGYQGRRDDAPRGESRSYSSRDGGGESRGGYQGRRDDAPRGENRSYGSRDDRGGQARSYGSRDGGGQSRGGYQGRRDGGGESRGGYQGRRDDDPRGESRGGYQGRRDDAPRGENRSYGSRDERGGQGRSYGSRDGGGYQGRRDQDDRPRRDEEENFVRPGLAAREDEPPTPEGVDEKVLPFGVRAELRGLPKDLAAVVAAHLVAAGELIDEDPELAYRHAEAARRRAARLPVVREATAETAYAAGEYSVALNEYRALRRMTGGAEYLPVMADCERALGRPNNALRLAKEAAAEKLEVDQRVEMIIVEAGARDDLGQTAEGLRVLKNAIVEKLGGASAQARLRYAYADMLERQGDTKGARQWFVSALANDTEPLLDCQDRIDALDGFIVEADLDDDEDELDESGDDQSGDDQSGDDQSGEDESDEDESDEDESDEDESDEDEDQHEVVEES